MRYQHIPFSLVSGSAKSDFMTLASAQNLVLSFGTFGPLSTCFNPCLRRVFTFNEMNHELINECASSDSVILDVMDVSGAYVSNVLSNNWKNTEFQRELMISYGVENLSLCC